jgi:hypothetical protein
MFVSGSYIIKSANIKTAFDTLKKEISW